MRLRKQISSANQSAVDTLIASLFESQHEPAKLHSWRNLRTAHFAEVQWRWSTCQRTFGLVWPVSTKFLQTLHHTATRCHRLGSLFTRLVKLKSERLAMKSLTAPLLLPRSMERICTVEKGMCYAIGLLIPVVCSCRPVPNSLKLVHSERSIFLVSGVDDKKS